MSDSETHPDPDVLWEYCRNKLAEDKKLNVEEHLRACPECLEVVLRTMRSDSA